MNPPRTPSATLAGFALLATALGALTGCIDDRAGPRSGYRGPPPVPVRAAVVFQDDYDYYPGYETYYSRNRHEYVYQEGNTWVRRSSPRGVAVNVLLAAPAVRLDFHDSPEAHHDATIKAYPRNWSPGGPAHDNRDGRKHDAGDDRRKDDKRNDP
jgi:hypothetical protein